MRKLFTRRSFRCVVCLILVCCLVVSWSPIRAQASALPEVAGVVTKVIPFNPGAGAAAGGAALGSQVFGWVLLGLGLIVNTAQAIHLMNQYTEFSGELETSIYYYPDGSWSYGVDMGFVERVRTFLFDSGILVPVNVNIPLSSGQFLDMGNEFNPGFGSDGSGFGVKWYHGFYQADGSYRCCPHWVLISLSPFTQVCQYRSDGRVTATSTVTPISVDVNGTRYYYRGKENHEWVTYTNKTSSYFTGAFDSTDLTTDLAAIVYYAVGGTLETGVESPYGYDMEVVPLPDIAFPIGYPEWHTNARPATNPETEEEITVLPIPLNPSADPDAAPDTLTQPDIWQGSIADPMPDSGTDTNPDTGTDLDTPGAPSTDIGDYQVDLTSFFPFCIPFDLYEFIRILCAEPEAPVFHWEVQDLSGNVYGVDVDLSPWNSHAQLFRDAQCLLFIIGLLMLTRKFIKW